MRQLSILSVFLALIALALAMSRAELTALPWYSKTILTIAVLWLILFEILGNLVTYNIGWGLPLAGIIEVSFTLPLWKRILRLWSPPQGGKVKAELRYKHADMTGCAFPVTGDWEDENEIWISLGNPMKKRLEIWWNDSDGNFYTPGVSRSALSQQFDVSIRLVAENGRCITEHTIKYQKSN